MKVFNNKSDNSDDKQKIIHAFEQFLLKEDSIIDEPNNDKYSNRPDLVGFWDRGSASSTDKQSSLLGDNYLSEDKQRGDNVN